MISKFWWGSKNKERKIHWTRCSKFCEKKTDEGMGFRDFRAFNLAILAKQGWRILQNVDSLMARTLKAHNFPRKNILQAQVCYVPSYTWHSIHESFWILEKGGFWHIRNGIDVQIWKNG